MIVPSSFDKKNSCSAMVTLICVCRDFCTSMNWPVASETFPKFVEVLSQPTYTYSAALGLTVSVGGLTESLVGDLTLFINNYKINPFKF